MEGCSTGGGVGGAGDEEGGGCGWLVERFGMRYGESLPRGSVTKWIEYFRLTTSSPRNWNLVFVLTTIVLDQTLVV